MGHLEPSKPLMSLAIGVLAACLTSTAAGGPPQPAVAPGLLEEEVLHGTSELAVNDRDQLVLVLDRMRSSQIPPDGIAELAIVFAPVAASNLESIENLVGRKFSRTTLDFDANGIRVTLPPNGSYELVVPQQSSDMEDWGESKPNAIMGLGFSRIDLQSKQISIDEALEEYVDFSAVLTTPGTSKANSNSSSLNKSIDCTTGGPGARSCSVSCPWDLGGCSVTCALELGYYACCSCYTGCGCKKSNTWTP